MVTRWLAWVAFARAEPDPPPPPSITVIGARRVGPHGPHPGRHAAWSPDRRIAVSAYGGPGNDDIAVIEVRTARFHRLTHAAGYEDSSVWSPHGRRLSWVRDGDLYLARADGSGGRLPAGRDDADQRRPLAATTLTITVPRTSPGESAGD